MGSSGARKKRAPRSVPGPRQRPLRKHKKKFQKQCTKNSRIGHRLQGRETLIGSNPRALRKRHGVRLHPRAVGASGRTIRFSDGSELDVATVIWATGFRPDHSWIDAPIFDDQGLAVHRRGVTDSPGLYFLGLSWQYTRGSALIGWVGEDAKYIAEQIQSFHRSRPKLAAGEAVATR